MKTAITLIFSFIAIILNGQSPTKHALSKKNDDSTSHANILNSIKNIDLKNIVPEFYFDEKKSNSIFQYALLIEANKKDSQYPLLRQVIDSIDDIKIFEFTAVPDQEKNYSVFESHSYLGSNQKLSDTLLGNGESRIYFVKNGYIIEYIAGNIFDKRTSHQTINIIKGILRINFHKAKEFEEIRLKLRTSLKAKGYDTGDPASSSLRPNLFTAIIEYQTDNNLKVGNLLSSELLYSLGIITPPVSINDTIVLNDNVHIVYNTSPFNSRDHSVDTCNTGLGYSRICKIDGQTWYGSDWSMKYPQRKLDYIIVTISNIEYNLDVSQMYNVSTLTSKDFNLIATPNKYVLSAGFSDGAGYYEAKWEIENGIGKRVLLTNNEEDF